MIEIKNLYKDWGAFSLKEINLEIKRGEYFVILGPTGAGKTLLLEMIAGFHSPDKGEIWIDGEDMTTYPPEERNVGFIYQDYSLFPHLNVIGNIRFGPELKGIFKEDIERESNEIMRLLGISHLSHRYPNTLSGGEQQKVAIARAIITRPSVLLLDEPLSALDRRTQDLLREELKWVHQIEELTSVHVTHDQTEAMILADRIAVMMDGRIVQVGAPHDIFNKPLNEDIASFVGVENILEGEIKGKRDGIAIIDVGDIELNAVSDYGEGEVKIFVRPEDILISKKMQESSARNSIRGKIIEMTNFGVVIHLQLDNGLIASVTKLSAEDLKLRIGEEVYASFKATSMHVVKKRRL
ncbi:MAG: ABC transporter ATP-binding protein [Candidatus Methanolliviera hydrocarbonicum]|uniref:Molybdate/tungstate import ATP-binding protein WtpC n=1 Tax=Candidatus Methanolliviera hydrocarbonicum TaxID=2491085 RepID=A0A520KVQ6_9EURY|nr:MAG: ABC transporter ATP-binding protein [Candidatus Methanolliviera hydrocarbonicum]